MKFKNKAVKRAISLITAFALLLISIPEGVFDDYGLNKIVNKPMVVMAADEESYPDIESTADWYQNKVAVLTSLDKILTYSRAFYSHPDKHESDTIIIGLAQGNTNGVLEDATGAFLPLGSYDHPFKGQVQINTASINQLIIKTAFFDYISDSATIVNYSDTTKEAPISLVRCSDNAALPILANHVKHDSEQETIPKWQVIVSAYTDNQNQVNTFNSAGMIGEMLDGAKIKLEVADQVYSESSITLDAQNNSVKNGNIYASDDVGYICGKMAAGSEITVNSFSFSYLRGAETVTANTTNIAYKVSTSNGHAGGIVGRMEDGSKLILNCSMPNVTASVTASGEKHYAGGIVGYNNGGIIELGTSYTTSNPYVVSNTVSGVAGAGAVFGYYRPYMTQANSSLEFDVAHYNNSSATVNGAGSVGGLFGVLENKYSYSVTTGEGNEASTKKHTKSGAITIKDSTTKSATVYAAHTDGSMANYGGLVGQYAASELLGSLSINDIAVSVSRAGGSYINYGGMIGGVNGTTENTDNAVYVSFGNDNVSVTSGNGADLTYGGLIANSTNAFVDVGVVSISSTNSYRGGGVVGKMEDGVLRFRADTLPEGVTNTVTLSGNVSVGAAYSEGNIVGFRDSSLVFAESGWTMSGGRTTADDIGSWGEIITFHDSAIENSDESSSPAFPVSDVLSVDTTAHTVQILAPTNESTYLSFSTLKDFTKTALCFKINDAENPILNFADTSYNSGTIVSQNMALGGNIDLRHTGLTGFTRDNASSDSVSAAKCVYSGTFNGGGNTVTLAIGEPNSKRYYHIYNGLFGIASAAKINNVTIAGKIDVNAKSGPMYVGGVASRANGTFESSGVNVSASFTHDGTKELYLGRLVGNANGAITINSTSSSTLSGSVTGNNSHASTCIGGLIGILSHASNATVAWNVNNVTLSGEISNTSAKVSQKIGGLIAGISEYKLANTNEAYNRRTLTLNGVTTDGLTVKGAVKNSSTNSEGALVHHDSSSGGLLGYSWLNADVVMTDVDISNSSKVELTGNDSEYGNMAGLVYQATGKWTVTDLDINSMTVDSAAKVNSFGLLVNTGWNKLDGSNNNALDSSALYILLPTTGCYNAVTDDNGTITSNVSFGTNFTAPNVYDELVAYSSYYRVNDNARVGNVSGDASDLYVLKNRQGVVSIHTDAEIDSVNTGLVMDDTNSSQSYAAQTPFGAVANPYTRYYYNLESMTGTTGPQALMRWALYHYAHKSIRDDFLTFGTNFSENTIPSGTYNLTGYSWYPVDVDSSVNVQGTFTFANKEFEGSETAKYNAESTTNPPYRFNRTSLYSSSKPLTQHFLLHEALFRNVAGTLTVNGDLTLDGTIGAIGSSGSTAPALTNFTGSGALVCGIVKGGSSLSTAKVEVSGTGTDVFLSGIKVHNLSTYSSYAPLLINKAGGYSNLVISGVKTTENAYTGGTTAATSLIGIAGSSSSKNVNVKFTDMKLDARTVANTDNTPDSGYGTVTLNDIYKTTRSIFTKATFLHWYSFDPTSGSTGTYTFTYDKDWTKTGDSAPFTYTHKGDVTYGLELWDGSASSSSITNALSSRTQYIGKEHNYSGASEYVSPVNGAATAAFDFGQSETESGFKYLPYVNIKYNTTNNTYQLQVNHGAASLTGCGTYNDPYLINDPDETKAGDQLERIERIIREIYDANSINIPKMDTTKVCVADGIITTTWHDSTNGHLSFTHKDASGDNPEGFYVNNEYPATRTNGINYLTNEQVRKYLAGAYYRLGSDVTLDNTDQSTGFKGLGSSNDDFAQFRGVIYGGGHKITNQTNYPLIASSYGCVVNNVDIVVDSNISKEQNKNTDSFKRRM